MIDIPESLYHRLFYNRLYVRGTKKPAFNGCRFCNPKFCICRKISLPGNRFCLLKELIKGHRPEFSHPQQHPLRSPKKDIGPADSRCVGPEGHLPVLHQSNLIAQILYFSLQHRLQTKMTGCDQFKCLHSISRSFSYEFCTVLSLPLLCFTLQGT